MDLTWETLAKSETTFQYNKIFNQYRHYIQEEQLNLADLASVIGHRYFTFDICSDEIMELFVEMTISRNSNGLTDYYAFVGFLFNKALYNNHFQDDIEAKKVFHTFIGRETPAIRYGKVINNSFDIAYTDFIKKLPSYNKGSENSEEDENMVYDTMYKFVLACKY